MRNAKKLSCTVQWNRESVIRACSLVQIKRRGASKKVSGLQGTVIINNNYEGNVHKYRGAQDPPTPT
jgi:hypothetical protein